MYMLIAVIHVFIIICTSRLYIIQCTCKLTQLSYELMIGDIIILYMKFMILAEASVQRVGVVCQLDGDSVPNYPWNSPLYVYATLSIICSVE